MRQKARGKLKLNVVGSDSQATKVNEQSFYFLRWYVNEKRRQTSTTQHLLALMIIAGNGNNSLTGVNRTTVESGTKEAKGSRSRQSDKIAGHRKKQRR